MEDFCFILKNTFLKNFLTYKTLHNLCNTCKELKSMLLVYLKNTIINDIESFLKEREIPSNLFDGIIVGGFLPRFLNNDPIEDIDIIKIFDEKNFPKDIGDDIDIFEFEECKYYEKLGYPEDNLGYKYNYWGKLPHHIYVTFQRLVKDEILAELGKVDLEVLYLLKRELPDKDLLESPEGATEVLKNFVRREFDFNFSKSIIEMTPKGLKIRFNPYEIFNKIGRIEKRTRPKRLKKWLELGWCIGFNERSFDIDETTTVIKGEKVGNTRLFDRYCSVFKLKKPFLRYKNDVKISNEYLSEHGGVYNPFEDLSESIDDITVRGKYMFVPPRAMRECDKKNCPFQQKILNLEHYHIRGYYRDTIILV